MTLLMNTVNYFDGSATTQQTLEETGAAVAKAENATALIGFSDPDEAEMAQLPDSFGIHELSIEDSTYGHQRAKLERYGSVMYLVLRPAVYLDKEEEIRLGELHLFVGPQFLVFIVRDYLHSSAATMKSFQQMYDSLPRPFTSMQVLHAILDLVVDEYFPVLEGLENDVDEIEDSLFLTDAAHRGLSRRIYELLNEVSDFQRAARPLATMLTTIMNRLRDAAEQAGAGFRFSWGLGNAPEDVDFAGGQNKEELVELTRRFRDVHDHSVHINERVNALRASLQNALSVHDTIVAQRQNDDMKRISAWAAILVVPTVIGSIYGMNFDVMPELQWAFGYPASLVAMVVVSFILWLIFKKKTWL